MKLTIPKTGEIWGWFNSNTGCIMNTWLINNMNIKKNTSSHSHINKYSNEISKYISDGISSDIFNYDRFFSEFAFKYGIWKKVS